MPHQTILGGNVEVIPPIVGILLLLLRCQRRDDGIGFAVPVTGSGRRSNRWDGIHGGVRGDDNFVRCHMQGAPDGNTPVGGSRSVLAT